MCLEKKTKKLMFFRITLENVYSSGFALAPPNLEELTNIGFIFGGANVRFTYIYKIIIHKVGAGPLMGEPYCFWK